MAGGAVGAKFNVNTVRALPGTPKPYEVYREQMIARYGLFAFTVVKYHLGKGESMTLRDFRQALKDSGMEMKPYEVNQVTNSSNIAIYLF
jgi:hypothetical protein